MHSPQVLNQIDRDVDREYEAFWNVAKPAYAIVAILTIASAIQEKATPHLFANAIIAVFALVATAAALGLTDALLQALGYGGPKVYEFVITMLRKPIPRAIVAFFLAHFIMTTQLVAGIGLVCFGAMLAYFEWSDAQVRTGR